MIKRLNLFLLFCFILNIAVFAQKKQGRLLVDSLLKELPKTNGDTNKVKVLNALSFALLSINPDNSEKYAQQALDIAKNHNWKKGMAGSNNLLAMNFQNRSNYHKALEYYLISKQLYQSIGNKKGLAAILGNMGTIYEAQSNYPKALECDFSSLMIDEQIQNKEGIASTNVNIGAIYDHKKEYDKALDCYRNALNVYQNMGDSVSVASTLANMGIAYSEEQSHIKALECYFRALKIDEATDNLLNLCLLYESIGATYADLNDNTRALDYFNKGMTIAEKINDKKMVASLSSNVGDIYFRLKNYPMAILQEQNALSTGLEINAPDVVIQSYQILADIYTRTGDYKKALEATEKCHALKDTIFSKDNGQKIVRLEMQYQYDRQHLADSLKAKEQEQLATVNLQRQRNYTYMGLAGIILLLGFSFFIVKERGKSEKERKKSDELLLNILPGEIAEELKMTGGSKAQHYDNVTVLFTDFVDFTKAGERMTPQALVDELDTCFKNFDNITSKYNIEKIKTIGDAYVAVCGLPKADHAHAESVVKAAREIKDFMLNRHSQLGDKTFEIRIGVHSGNVVAGIVGVKKFAYDIWGDTVNTAARMEQNSEAGKINISETTYELVKDRFTCTYRGEIEAKNKGVLKMYFVI